VKKAFKLTWLAIAVFSIFIMTACFPTGGVTEDDLVGMWEWNRDTTWTYTFHEDGTGSRGIIGFDYHEFEWTITRGELRIECPVAMFGVISERWRATIEDGELTVVSAQGGPTYIYHRIEYQTESPAYIVGIHEDDLVGTWVWNLDRTWVYSFREDGTGIRGALIDLDYREFEWAITHGELRIECPVSLFGVASERWEATIAGDTLTLSSLQDGGTFTYERINYMEDV